MMRTRSLLTGLALLASGTFIGATTQHFASASVSSGERPVLISITPCRLVDTRPDPNTVGPRSAPLGAGDTHTVDTQEADTPCSGMIPVDASALSLNITALNATEQSFLTVWAGGERPVAASLNPAPGQPPVPNAVTTELSVDNEFEVYNDTGSVSIVVDVNGYYVDHNHDDRYYTKQESDARYLDGPDEIFLTGSDFVPSDSGIWRLDEFVWRKGPGTASCLAAAIEPPVGATVEAVIVRYVAPAPVELITSTAGLSRNAGDSLESELYLLHHLNRSTNAPATAVGEVGSIRIVDNQDEIDLSNLPLGPIAADRDVTAQICASEAISVLGMTLELS